MVSSGSRDRFYKVWREIEPIEGWLTAGQAKELFAAAASVRTGAAIVEIGSHRGKSTILLAKAKRPETKLLAVDPFRDPRWGGGAETLEMFRQSLRRYGVVDQVTFHRGTSLSATRAWSGERVGLLYVDGAHDRAAVVADIDAWRPYLQHGSLIYFHDAFSSPGVTAAVLQRLFLRRRCEYLGSVQSLAMFRTIDVSMMQTFISGSRLLFRLGYLARNIAIKIALRRRWRSVPRLLGHRGLEYPY